MWREVRGPFLCRQILSAHPRAKKVAARRTPFGWRLNCYLHKGYHIQYKPQKMFAFHLHTIIVLWNDGHHLRIVPWAYQKTHVDCFCLAVAQQFLLFMPTSTHVIDDLAGYSSNSVFVQAMYLGQEWIGRGIIALYITYSRFIGTNQKVPMWQATTGFETDLHARFIASVVRKLIWMSVKSIADW